MRTARVQRAAHLLLLGRFREPVEYTGTTVSKGVVGYEVKNQKCDQRDGVAGILILADDLVRRHAPTGECCCKRWC